MVHASCTSVSDNTVLNIYCWNALQIMHTAMRPEWGNVHERSPQSPPMRNPLPHFLTPFKNMESHQNINTCINQSHDLMTLMTYTSTHAPHLSVACCRSHNRMMPSDAAVATRRGSWLAAAAAATAEPELLPVRSSGRMVSPRMRVLCA